MQQPNLVIHHVCGLDELRVAPLSSADRVVSILDPGAPMPHELRSIDAPVLVLRFEDVADATDAAAPRAAHIRELLAFDAGSHEGERLVVHCSAGIFAVTATTKFKRANFGSGRCFEPDGTSGGELALSRKKSPRRTAKPGRDA